MKIFLLGFMGCGKSYVGKQLANLMNWPFIDLDEEIVKNAEKSISEIFKSEGEATFRIWEQKSLQLLEKASPSIVSLGGGTPCFFDNMDLVNKMGISVYLKCNTTVLVKRLKSETEKRPLLAGKNEIELQSFLEKKIAERSPFYKKAQLVYEIKNGEEKIAEELRQFFERLSGKK